MLNKKIKKTIKLQKLKKKGQIKRKHTNSKFKKHTLL